MASRQAETGNPGGEKQAGGDGGRRRLLLVLEPYHGGSHRQFIEGLVRHLDCRCTLFQLPARAWKWRMRLAAIHFAGLMAEMATPPDTVLCSSYVDVALLRALAPPWLAACRLVTYFHENQFAYPVRSEDERDAHFAVTNLTTALASDAVLFNSEFNRTTFLEGARSLLSRAPDMKFAATLTALSRKSAVLPPGLDAQAVAPVGREAAAPPVVLWNHRWEHDKNPEEFFESLFTLQQRGVPFQVAVLGQAFQQAPPIFAAAQARLAGRLLQFGYAEREHYHRLLARADVVVSTARHEFFGYSVLEAVQAGCRPLLPDRLSYPELFPAQYLYAAGELADRLAESLAAGRLDSRKADRLTGRFLWRRLAARYRRMLFPGEKKGAGPE